MTRYLLDTNACIALMKGNAGILARLREVGMEALWLCTPVKAELWFGACKSQRVAENQARLRLFFNDLPSLPFDDIAAEHFGEIRAFLARQGTPIGPYDLQIAAIARAHNLIVVTHNTGEFSRVPGLVFENWQT
jgi:tRNA(fMet)-specific endonuclease VapC